MTDKTKNILIYSVSSILVTITVFGSLFIVMWGLNQNSDACRQMFVDKLDFETTCGLIYSASTNVLTYVGLIYGILLISFSGLLYSTRFQISSLEKELKEIKETLDV